MDWSAQLSLPDLERQYRLPAGLLASVLQQESAGKADAVSPAGAQGLFQFMPATAQELGIDPLDPAQAAQGAARYLSKLNTQFDGDLTKTLAAYNWGPGNVAKKGLAQLPPETAAYIPAVLGRLPAQMADSGQIMNDGITDEQIAAMTPQEAQALLAQIEPEQSPDLDIDALTPEQARALLAEQGIGVEPAAPVAAQPNGLRLAVDQFNQGTLAGFGDEVTDAIGSGIAYASLKGRDVVSRLMGEQPAYENETYGGIYDAARADSQSRLQQEQANNPGASALAQLAGAIPGTILAAGAIGAAAPATAAKFGTYAASNPLRAAAGASALQGGVYGAGVGSGTLEDRAEKAVEFGALGGVAGPLLSQVGRSVIAPVGARAVSLAQGPLSKVSGLLQKTGTSGKAGGEIAALEAQPAIQATTDYAPNLQRADGSIFSKTEGQRTQQAAIQRLENDSRAGTYGNKAESLIREVDIKQNREYHQFIDQLAGSKGLNKNTDINALVDGVAGTIQRRYGDAQASVRSAYDLANSGREGVKISSQDIRQGLWKGIGELRRENGFDISQMPKARSALENLAKLSGRGKFKGVTAAKLGALENWRKVATNAANDARGTSEGVFMSQVVRKYDDFMLDTANNAVAQGDAAAINAFREAVSKRADMGRLFERNKVVQGIAKGELGLDDTVKTLIGTGALTGKRNMASTYDAIVKAAGTEARQVTDDLRQAFTIKTFQNATSGYEPGNPNLEAISPAKLKTQLENLFVHQSQFADKLYGKETADAARKAIDELRLISNTQAGVRNPSGSGEWLGRFLQLPGIGRLPGIGLIPKAIEAQADFTATNQLKRGLGDFLSDSIDQSAASPLWATRAVPAATVPLDSLLKGPPVDLPQVNPPTE